jgi:alkylation response protein AidB-like acyl-CoA dehydrogenase
MQKLTIRHPDGRPAPSGAPHAFAGAVALADAGAEAADRDRSLSAPTVEALTGAGFARHFVPRRWGGTEGGFAELLARAAELGEASASAAWCAMLWAAHGRFATRLPEQAQQELWAAGPDVRLSAALAPPSGRVERRPDGWLLDGNWHCVSGALHADWFLLTVPGTEPGGGEALVLAVPAERLTVSRTWHAPGLRGTGSDSVAATGVVVPAHRAVPLAELLAARPEASSRGGQAPALLGGGLLFCAPALGAARRALRAWTAEATAARPGRESELARAADARLALARSAGEIEAAELLLRQAAERADHGPLDAQTVGRNQRDAAVGLDLLVTAVERLVRSGGVHTRSGADGALDRAWRDLHTAASHAALRLQSAADAWALTLVS